MAPIWRSTGNPPREPSYATFSTAVIALNEVCQLIDIMAILLHIDHINKKDTCVFNFLCIDWTMFKLACSLCVPFTLFCSPRNDTSKNLSQVSCSYENNFNWQSAKIRLPYHLGLIYTKWLVLRYSYSA